MELIEGLNSRRSIRGFKPEPIAHATIAEILQVAGRSPSYTNTQPWEVAVVTGAKRDALSQILYDLAAKGTPSNADIPAPTTWPAAAAERSKVHNINRFKALGIGREDTAKRDELRLGNFKFFNAPCAMFIFMDEGCGPWSTMDMGSFIHALTLAAVGKGLGACLQASLANYPDAVREFLGIPASKKLLVGMSLGVPDLEAPLNAYRSSRMSLDEFVTWYE